MKTQAILIATIALLLGTDAGLVRPAPDGGALTKPAPGEVGELTKPAPGTGNDLTKPAPQPDIDSIKPLPGTGGDLIKPLPGTGGDLIKPLPGTGGDLIKPLPEVVAPRNVLPHLGKYRCVYVMITQSFNRPLFKISTFI
jgi:hypothetical protein